LTVWTDAAWIRSVSSGGAAPLRCDWAGAEELSAAIASPVSALPGQAV